MTRTLLLLASLVLAGCGSPASPPSADLPPAYPRSQINDPRLAEAARGFTAWARAQTSDGKPLYERVEMLPPVDTLLPYGMGAFQKSPRLPAILTTGSAWATLKEEAREEAVKLAFRELTSRLAESPVKATLTVQTPQGLELAWVNEVIPGQKLLHGED